MEDFRLPQFDAQAIVKHKLTAQIMSAPCRYDVIVGMDLLPLLGVDILTSSMEVKALDTVLPMQPRDEWELHCLDSYLNNE
jgi:hypothetical protein